MSDNLDDEYKRMLINRNKRLFNNILRQLQNGRAKGVVSNEEVEQYKSKYNDIVIEASKQEYLKYKTREGKYNHEY